MIFTPQFVIAADTHLRLRTWADYPDLCGDAFYSFNQIADFSALYGVPLLLLGDIFNDPHPDATTVALFQSATARCPRVYVIQGNHDYCDEQLGDFRGTWGGLGGVHVGQGPFTIPPAAITGIDYLPRRQLREALAKVTTPIVAAHQAWKDLNGAGTWQGEFSWLPPHVHTLLTGDLHQTIVKQYGPLLVVSPGSTCMQAINEPPEKFFIVAGTLPDGRLEYLPYPLKTRPVFDLRIDNEAKAAQLERELAEGVYAGPPDLPEMVRKPILRVSYPRALRRIYPRLVAACGDRVHLFANPHGDSGELEIVITTKATGDSLLSTIETMRGGKDHVYRGIERMLTTPGKAPEDVLADMEKEFLAEVPCKP